MKPSERIQEIYNKLRDEDGIFSPPDLYSKAISIYIDEEFEKNQPCKHEPSGETVGRGYVCKHCHVIYYI